MESTSSLSIGNQNYMKLRYYIEYQSVMLRSFLLICAVIFFGQSEMNAQGVKYSNEFLKIGIGARAHGMGLAQVASVNDVTGAYWNPAGLSGFKAPFQIGVMHAEWFAGIASYDYLGFAKKLNEEKESTIGLTIIRLGIDQIPNTLRLYEKDGSINYDNLTEFSAADYGIFGSFARKVKLGDKNLRVGANAKVIRRVIGTFGNSWGFGLDIAALYELDKWRFGLVARDVTTTFNSWSFNLKQDEKEVFEATGNDIPVSSIEITRPTFSFGTAFISNLGENVSFVGALDFDITTDGQRNVLVSSKGFNLDPRFGLELGYKKFLFLRGGVNNFQKALDDIDGSTSIMTFQPNFGVGLKFGRLKLDYAFTDVGNASQALYSHIFSLLLDLKEKKKTL